MLTKCFLKQTMYAKKKMPKTNVIIPYAKTHMPKIKCQRNVNVGRFPFSQNFRNFRFGGKWNTFRRFVPLENSQKKVENLKRWARFPGWNFRTKCRVPFMFLVVCTSSRSTVGHRDLPGFMTKWNNF